MNKIKVLWDWGIGLMGRVFVNGPVAWGSIPGCSHTKDSKIGTWFHLAYKLRIKGKVEQSSEWSSALPFVSVW